MSEPPVNSEGWTLGAYIAHNEAVRVMQERLDKERDRRYSEVASAKEASASLALELARVAASGVVAETQRAIEPLTAYVLAQQGRREGIGLSANVLVSAITVIGIVVGAVAAIYFGTH